MRFKNPDLIVAIDETCRAADPFQRAVGHNLRWDERLGPDRVQAFEQTLSLPDGAGFAALVDAYRAYFTDRIRWDGRSAPGDTYQAVNDGAALDQLPDERRELVRMVKIADALDATGLSYNRLKEAVDLYSAAGPDNGTEPVLHARGTIETFLTQWNAFDKRPPAFAGFVSDVAEDLAGWDWADRLRRRFGMGHLHVAKRGDHIPVMLLRYKVNAVLGAAATFCRPESAIRVPTVLESNFYAYFYPSPTPLPYGRTVDLDGGQDPERLTCEVVHLPVDVEISHITGVDRLTGPIYDALQARMLGKELVRVRNDHFEVLRYETGRDDFGEKMTDDAARSR